MRLDLYLKEIGLVKSRTKAQELINSNNILLDGLICNDVKKEVSEKNTIKILNNIKYVGRGGEKLEHALKEFKISLENKVSLDIGSSTGGFTDCLLQNNILEVYCVDVGTMQLDPDIKNNKKVKTFENTDIRNFNKENKYRNYFDLIVCDISFISITKIVLNIFELLKEGGEGVILIKPQFEVGRENIGKGGLVKSEDESVSYEELIEKTISNIKTIFENNKLKVINIIDSPILGGDGNKEFLMHIKK